MIYKEASKVGNITKKKTLPINSGLSCDGTGIPISLLLQKNPTQNNPSLKRPQEEEAEIKIINSRGSSPLIVRESKMEEKQKQKRIILTTS